MSLIHCSKRIHEDPWGLLSKLLRITFGGGRALKPDLKTVANSSANRIQKHSKTKRTSEYIRKACTHFQPHQCRKKIKHIKTIVNTFPPDCKQESEAFDAFTVAVMTSCQTHGEGLSRCIACLSYLLFRSWQQDSASAEKMLVLTTHSQAFVGVVLLELSITKLKAHKGTVNLKTFKPPQNDNYQTFDKHI